VTNLDLLAVEFRGSSGRTIDRKSSLFRSARCLLGSGSDSSGFRAGENAQPAGPIVEANREKT
jgi:hypothetical protein